MPGIDLGGNKPSMRREVMSEAVTGTSDMSCMPAERCTHDPRCRVVPSVPSASSECAVH